MDKEELQPPLLNPLITRVRSGQIVIGLIDSASVPVQAILEALNARFPLPLRVVLIGSLAPEPRGDHGNDAIEHYPLEAAALAPVLPQLEAMCLPAILSSRFSRILAQLAVPTLSLLDDDPDSATWSGPGLAVAGASAEDIVALLHLLTTDPPTRRRALASQRAHESEPTSGTWRIEGVFDSSYSLALVNRHLALALDAVVPDGDTAALFTFEQGETPEPRFDRCETPDQVRALWHRSRDPLAPVVALRNAWPPIVRDMRGHHRLLASYHWEETGFPAHYAQDFNRVLDLITTGSTQTARFLQDAGTDVPIATVGNGIDHLLEIQPEAPPLDLPIGFRFLHVSSCLPRKGIDILLEAYGKAFRDRHDVSLIIKTYPNPHNDAAEQLSRWRQRDPHFPQVIIRQDDWTPAQIAGLYQACHALVAPSRGEGFGLPIAEAMLHRLPVIATGWGGHMDYCYFENAWLIDYRLDHADTHLSTPGSLWAEPKTEHLTAHLRAMYTDRGSIPADKLDRARQCVIKRYSWHQVAARTRAALEQIQAQPGPLPTPRIGWISSWGSRCGIAAYSGHLSAALPINGLFVLAPDDEVPEHPDPPFVSRCWSFGQSVQGAAKRLLAAADSLQLDACVIQHHWGWFDLAGLRTLIGGLRQRGIAVFLDLHNTRSAPPAIIESRYRNTLRDCTRILVHGLTDMHRMQDWGLEKAATLFPLAVYAVPQASADQQRARREQLALGPGPLLATFGYLMPHKGLAEMIQAMPEILARHPDARLLMLNALYNADISPPERDRLQGLIDRLGLADHILLESRYLPEAECVAMLGLADLIAFPYQHTEESSSAAVRMAIAAGRPIAVTPLPFFDDVASAVRSLPGTTPAQIAEGVAGILDDFRDPQASAAAASRVRECAVAHDSRVLAERLRGMIYGTLRQLPDSPSAPEHP